MRKRGVLILACAFGVLALAQTSPGAGLRTGFMDPYAFTEGGSSQLAFQRAGNAGATAARLVLTWRAVAPGGSVKPGGFDATDSNSPQYNQAQWAAFDLQVRRAVEAGLDPIVSISLAPDWAEGPEDWLPGTVRPDPTEFGLFAQAAAKRYSGLFPGLEGIRVRYWQAWNEPNIKDFFWPHFLNGVLFSPGHYRQMVNAFAANVRSVATNDGTTNLVVAGGLAPFGHTNQVGPLRFMRAMLCISKTNRAVAGCGTGVNFDIWSTHPYTEGGPTHAALSPDNVSIGDLPDMRAVLRAALRAGHVRA